MTKHTCAFHDDHEPETLSPRGNKCGRRATQEIYWCDGRVSPSCDKHGMAALDVDARALVAQVFRPQTEAQWATKE